MKKYLILSALAVGLMTSCSDDEYVPSSSVDSNTIAFSTKSNQTITRSGSTLNSISKFTVTAVNADKTSYFNGVEFNYNAGTGVFQSATPYYWPVSSSLNFYAISNPGSVSLDANNAPVYSYENWGGETDLVAATVLAGEKRIPYPLTFQHVLSQVSVSAEASDKTEALSYKLVGVDMTTPAKGTYSFANASAGFGTWEIDKSSEKTYSYADALPKSFTNTGSVNSGSTYWNILPVTDGKIKFNVAYQVFQNGKMIADFTGSNAKACEVESPNLLSGKRYVYNFKLTRGSDESITFTLDLKDWVDGTTTDITLGGSMSSSDNAPSDVVAVDLGLPSGIKWASMNVGATTPEEAGLYFSFGETTGHNKNGVGNYVFTQSFSIMGACDLPLNMDAANVNWGGSWRMPTYAEYDELIFHTEREVATVNGVNGLKFYKKNGGEVDKSVFVFFPVTGLYENSLGQTHGGYYRSASNPEGTYGKYFCFGGYSVSMSNGSFWWGMPVRPVSD